MKNTEMTAIARELIASANLPENVEIKVFEGAGNSIMLRSFRHYPPTELTRISQIGYGLRLWGVQGEERIRNKIAAYIAGVAA